MRRRTSRAAAVLFALACTLLWGSGGALTHTAYAEDVNLALNKTAQASDHEAGTQFTADKAFDGKTSGKESRWASSADATDSKDGGPHWLMVDLGEDTEIRSLRLFWEQRKAKGYQIQVATGDTAPAADSESWETVWSNDGHPTELNETIVLDEAHTARYVRVYIEHNVHSDPDGGIPWGTVALYEVEVYATELDDPTEQGVNLALNKATKASADHNNENGRRLTDGSKDAKTGRWMTEQAPTQWAYVDLGKTETFDHFVATWESQAEYATDFNIYVSDDAQTWGDPVYSKTGNKDAVSTIALDSPVSGRYVKLEVTKVSNWPAVSCSELEIYNGEPPVPEKQPADYLNDIVVDEVTATTDKLSYTLPEAPEGYEITYNGTDYEQVIDLNGTIYHPISNVTVKASFKIANKTDATDYAFKEFEVTVPGTMTAPANANAAPQILPELREWVGSTGTFSNAKRVVYADDTLKPVAEQFAADYADITGATLTVAQGTTAQAGDILFALTTDTSLGLQDEGYLLEATSSSITVTSEQLAGANWGGVTILQGMKQSGDTSFPCGTARDYPLYRVRGLILDVGRKTFSLDWLKQMTKLMSWYKMNDFQVHLNDNLIPLENYTNAGQDAMQAYSGFRLESDIKEGGNGGKNKADLTSTDVWYTKADFKEFIEQAQTLGVNIVPEIDTPAHSLALTKVRPDLRYGTNGRQNDHLDLRGAMFDESLSFVQSIFDEYVVDGGDNAVFADADVIHIGADEYNVGTNAESSPLYRKFVNEMFEYAYENGHTPRVWGSLSQYTTGDPIDTGGTDGKPRAQINLWNWGYANMDKMYEAGFDLIDCNDGHFYIVPNATYYYDYLNDGTAYTDPLNSISSVTIPAGDPQIAGGAFAVWNDMCDMLENGMSEYDVYDRIANSMGLFGANAWGKGTLDTASATTRANALGDAPNVNFGYEADSTDDDVYAQWNMDDLSDASDMARDLTEGENAGIEEVDGRSALKLNGGSSYVSVKDEALTTLGLGNDLRVKVKRTGTSDDEQVLFESTYGTIKAVQKDTGQVGITRENHDYSFNYTLPFNEWVELEIINEFELTHLYVNGELVDTIGTHTRGSVKATCMLPVERIGSTENAFEGYVDDVRLTTALTNDAGAFVPFNSTMELDRLVVFAEAILSDRDIPGMRDLLDQAYELFHQVNPSEEQITSLVEQIDKLLTDVEYEVADYSRVDAYMQLVFGSNSPLASVFTEEGVARIEAAVAQMRVNLPAAMQETVDGYERALVKAFDALELKDAGDITLIDPSTLTATASSYESASATTPPEKALDGDLNTQWHSAWNITTGEHWLALTSQDPMSVNGLVYTPRQSGTNGNLKKYRIEVSTDGTTFTKVDEGEVSVSGTDPLTIKFPQQDNVCAVKLVWINGVNGNASAAELRLIDASVRPDFDGLQSIVDVVETVERGENPARFSDATWDALQEKLDEAKACIKDQTASIEDVYALKGELAMSMMSLRLDKASTPDPDPDPVDKTELQAKVDEYSKLDASDYTEDSFAELTEALEAARVVLADDKATADDVASALKSLEAAHDGLVTATPDPEPKEYTVTIDDRVPGHEDVVLTVKEGEKIPAQEDPVLEGWKFVGWFTDGYEGGFKDEWDFDTDVVTSDMTLTAQWVEDGDGSVDPEPPTDPEQPSKPGSSDQTDGSMPKTGDDTMLLIGGVGILAVVAIAAGIIVSRRGKNRN